MIRDVGLTSHTYTAHTRLRPRLELKINLPTREEGVTLHPQLKIHQYNGLILSRIKIEPTERLHSCDHVRSDPTVSNSRAAAWKRLHYLLTGTGAEIDGNRSSLSQRRTESIPTRNGTLQMVSTRRDDLSYLCRRLALCDAVHTLV